METIWKKTKFENYEVNNFGQVRTSIDTRGKGFRPGNILFQAKSDHGYKQVYLYIDKKQKTIKVHTLVAETFLGEKPIGFTVNHKNKNKEDNSLENLEYVSVEENIHHYWRNSKSSVFVRGENLSLGEAVKKYAIEGVGYIAVRKRYRRRGWDIETALTTPLIPAGEKLGLR